MQRWRAIIGDERRTDVRTDGREWTDGRFDFAWMRRCGCNSLRNAADKEQKGDFAQPYCLLSITTAARLVCRASSNFLSCHLHLPHLLPLSSAPLPMRIQTAWRSTSSPVPWHHSGALRRKRAEKRNGGATISPIGYFCSLLSKRAGCDSMRFIWIPMNSAHRLMKSAG